MHREPHREARPKPECAIGLKAEEAQRLLPAFAGIPLNLSNTPQEQHGALSNTPGRIPCLGDL